MIINVGGREYEMRFGIAALDYLDKVYVTSAEGIEFSVGLSMFSSQVQMRNVTAMIHAIKAGTCTEPQRPSNKAIEEFIGSMDEEEMELFFLEVTDELKKQPLTRIATKKVLSAMSLA